MGETAGGKDGAVTKAEDKRRSVVGVSIQVEGSLASKFSVKYAVKLKGKDNGWRRRMVRGRAVEMQKGAAVEGLRVWI